MHRVARPQVGGLFTPATLTTRLNAISLTARDMAEQLADAPAGVAYPVSAAAELRAAERALERARDAIRAANEGR